MRVVLILTTVPTEELGASIGRALIEARLAACVNILPPMTSIYRWHGAVTTDTERQVVIKTTDAQVPAVQERLRALHSYELPECLVLPVSGGSDAYLDWVRQESAP